MINIALFDCIMHVLKIKFMAVNSRPPAPQRALSLLQTPREAFFLSVSVLYNSICVNYSLV